MDEERFDFENLKVYQKALEYVDFVYGVTKDFPKEEIFSLIDQFTLQLHNRPWVNRSPRLRMAVNRMS